MKNRIEQIIKPYVSLDSSELDSFINILKSVEFKNNQHFIQEGQLVNQIFIIDDGLFEMYSFDENKKETSLDFFTSNDFATDYVSYLTEMPSEVNIRALKQSSIFIIEKQALNELYERSNNLQKLGRVFAEYSFINFANRIRNNFLTPEERYLKLLKESSDWIQNIPQYKIASYLNITPEWLSKIRAKK